MTKYSSSQSLTTMAVALADSQGPVLLQSGLILHDGEHVDRSNKKRVRFEDSDSDYDDMSVDGCQNTESVAEQRQRFMRLITSADA